ncbi:glycoside hydrolase family 99-like domain-containing protein [Geothrix terrae]|uniref:glycoside hydrolase family 99-like domain-containing protein n=1 Tax=Geothrix terrae TaxID=2922720 RepID=UPI001FADDDD7|nr:glycoside hydrolase family 99-like domain-containing protein [Geothrix terrae]
MMRRLLAFVLGACCLAMAQVPSDYRIGVYYYPGWKATAKEDPWAKIKPYKEREPLLGFYPEGDVATAETQLGWMHQYGIDFVLYDWYWSPSGQTYLNHAVDAYLQAKNRTQVKFGVIWCNHTDRVPSSVANFDAMVDYWIKTLFSQPTYLREDGKPVVVVFSPQELYNLARKIGTTSNALLAKARAKARAAGYPGIHFVGCAAAQKDYVNGLIVGDGYDAVTTYNYGKGYSGEMQNNKPLPTTFQALAEGYRENWDWMVKQGTLPYWVPVIAGWNKRPWGSDTPHDNCVSTPATFTQHLKAAKAYLDQYPQKTRRTLVICAWNEFGEGSYIEPTRLAGKAYLEAIQTVFRKK